MLKLMVPETELFDELSGEFVKTKAQTLQLEHSLVSLAKWESKWKKAYIGTKDKTDEEAIDYIRCMTITQNVVPDTYIVIGHNRELLGKINEYIDDSMTAATFSKSDSARHSREKITAETLSHAMIVNNIPLECQKWHLNRLLTLIRFCSVKNGPSKKMGTREQMMRNAKINAKNRKKYNSKG